MKVVLTLFLCAVASAFGQTNALEMPMLGQQLPSRDFTLDNRIPASRAASLPQNLPVFRYSARPSNFSTNALQKLLDQSVFSGTNIIDVLQTRTNDAPLNGPIRLATTNHLDFFFVDPLKGAISVRRHGIGVDLRTETPAFDTIPDFEIMRERLIRYAEMFGVTTNELERNNDGSIFLRKTENKTVARGGAKKFMSKRSVRVARTAAGYPFLANDDRVELALGVNGRLLQFDLKWRALDAIRTNRLSTIDQILDNVKNGKVFADEMNQYPSDGIAKITIKDFRVFYFIPATTNFRPISTNVDIFPIVSLHAVFTSKSGKSDEGGLYTSLIQP